VRPTASAAARPLFAYIDCVRGYAVVLVITCHLTGAFAELPYPVHRLTTLGWHGVQLFFLASAVTLLMSWHHDLARFGRAPVAPFFIRRFFRIVPAYYAAAAFYAWLEPPAGAGFDPAHLFTALGFLNSWSPWLMPTEPGLWVMVPGGWSVDVEMTFYLVFPLFVVVASNLRRAALLFGLCLLVGGLANRWAASVLAAGDTPVAIDNFLYFWFPDQMAVFALGGVLYFAIGRLSEPAGAPLARLLARHGTLAPAAALALFFATAYVKLSHWTGMAPSYLPGFIVVSLCLAGFILALAAAPRSVFINPLAAAMGKASFSAYLLHFAVLQATVERFPALFHTGATGLAAIAAFAAAWLVVVPLTFAVSWISYRALELPMMRLGKVLAQTRWQQVAQAH
jgi:peptidoglycan/LPS O-acetylase OafA/YrhL